MNCGCVYDSANRKITFTVNSTWAANIGDYLHWIKIGGITNWPFAGKFGGWGLQIETGTNFTNYAVSYTEDAFVSASVTNSDNRAAFPNIHTFALRTKTSVPTGGTIVIIAPSQISYAGSSLTFDTSVKIGTTTITGTTVTQPSSGTIVINGAFLSTAAANTQIEVKISNMRNPVSVNVPSSSYQIKTATVNTDGYDAAKTGLTITSIRPGNVTI